VLTCFARSFVIKFIKTFGEIGSISAHDGLPLSAIQKKFEGWE
jgi:hypothetical protein